MCPAANVDGFVKSLPPFKKIESFTVDQNILARA